MAAPTQWTLALRQRKRRCHRWRALQHVLFSQWGVLRVTRSINFTACWRKLLHTASTDSSPSESSLSSSSESKMGVILEVVGAVHGASVPLRRGGSLVPPSSVPTSACTHSRTERGTSAVRTKCQGATPGPNP